ncbi:MAG: radical SAM protein [Longimicrobiales bacterium]|nr:radical SAM protein [Longimicrobiales bacterium]
MTEALPTVDRRRPPMEDGEAEAVPEVPLRALDQLWFQVAGTVCNLRCNHCFISCAPDNHSFWFMSRDEVAESLQASVELGVKEYYFTGGEPFMNREMTGILEDALSLGPATVLTNATLLPQRTVDDLRRLSEASPYTLELRVSIDGVTREMNDAIRGEGTFDRAMDAVGRLAAAGFLPIITTMQSWDDHETDGILQAFRELLAGVGYRRPRLKILPPLRIGAEARRTRGYDEVERVTLEMMSDYPSELLLCSSARLVTAAGVWVCPILLDDPAARLGDSLSEAAQAPARLESQACYTCWVNGAICSNVPGFTDFQ